MVTEEGSLFQTLGFFLLDIKSTVGIVKKKKKDGLLKRNK